MLNQRKLIIQVVGAALIAGLSALLRPSSKKGQGRPLEAQGEESEQVFLLPKTFSYLALICGLMALAFVGGALYGYFLSSSPQDRGSTVLLGAGAAGGLMFGYFAVHLLRLRSYTVLADSQGLTEIRYGRATHLAWTRIVRLEGKPLMQRLVLSGGDGTQIKLEYQLEGLGILLDRIFRRVLLPLGPQDLPRRFGKADFRQRQWRTPLLFCLPALLLWALPIAANVFLACFWAGLVLLVSIGDRFDKRRRVRFIELDRECLTLAGYDQDQRIPIEALLSAQAVSYFDQNSNTRLRTLIKTRDKEIAIQATVADPIALVPLLNALIRSRAEG